MGQAQRRQRDEEIVLRNAKLQMLAGWPLRPAIGGGDLLFLETVRAGRAVEHAAPVHPSAHIGGDGHIRRCRHHARGEVRLLARQIEQDAAEALLRGHFLCLGQRQFFRRFYIRSLEAAAALCIERHGVEKGAELCFAMLQPFEQIPFMAFAHLHALLEFGHLRGGHEPRMIVLVARERQAHALDGVGDETHRPVVIDAVEGIDQQVDVVPAEIAHQRGKLLIVI